MKRPVLVFALIAVLLASAGYGIFILNFQTYHFAVVQDGVLFRDGLQGMRRFQNAYRQHPFKAVINLQSESDIATKYQAQVADEKKFCAENQIAYFSIPMKEETPPTDAQIQEYLKIIDDPKNRPVFVHDSQGVIREGMMVAVWQLERMGYDSKRALDEINSFGHPNKSEALLDFIKNYKKSGDRTVAEHPPKPPPPPPPSPDK